MTQTTHTPGPWQETAAPDITDSSGELIARCYRRHGLASCANARLIASAPDLLATLQYILDAADYDGALTLGTAALSPAIRDRIVRTIAEATGAN